MNDNQIMPNTANDFSVRMSINKVDIDKEIAVLSGQINVLQKQGIITEETKDLLWDQLREIIVLKNKIESDYYEMRNQLKILETKKPKE